MGLTTASGLFWLLEALHGNDLSLTLHLYHIATIPVFGFLFYYTLMLKRLLQGSAVHG